MASEDLRTAGDYFQEQIIYYLSHGADKCIDDDEISSVPCCKHLVLIPPSNISFCH